MKGEYIPWFVLLFLCSLNAVSFGQSVTIRVIHLNGVPFKNKQVYISGLSAKATSEHAERLKLTRRPIRADLSLLTDNKGEAAFDLPNPAPAYVYVRPVFSERVWDCTCFISVPTDRLLQKGIRIIKSNERKNAPLIQPKAEEILFVMGRTPWWWWLIYDIEKG
jgi:hypothetical protein